MTIEEIMGECPSLEHVLRAKEGRFSRLLEAAITTALDDVNDPNKPADAVRAVKLKLTMRPDAERSSVRLEVEDPTVALAKRPSESAQMYIVETAEGAQLHAPNLNQESISRAEARGHGLHTEEIS